MTSHYVQNKIPIPLSLPGIYVPATSFPLPFCSSSTDLSSLPKPPLALSQFRMFASGWCLCRFSHGWPPPSLKEAFYLSGCAHIFPTHPRCEVYRLSSAKIYLEVKASGRSKTHHGLALSADFLTPKEPFCTCVVSPESRGRGWRSGRERRSLNPLPKQDFSPLCSITAMAVILRCLQEIKPGCLPCLSCYFYFRWQTGGRLLRLYLEPTYLLSQEMQTGG